VVEIPSIHTIDSLPTLIPSSLYSTDLGSSNMIVPAINDDNDNTTTPHDELQAYVKEPIIMWEDIQTQWWDPLSFGYGAVGWKKSGSQLKKNCKSCKGLIAFW